MTKEEQQARATLNDHIVIHKVTDTILAKHRDGTEIYAVDVIKKPLVRCKDCTFYNAGFECIISGYGIKYPPMWYCADGERKESE